jgi:hypothetical protein
MGRSSSDPDVGFDLFINGREAYLRQGFIHRHIRDIARRSTNACSPAGRDWFHLAGSGKRGHDLGMATSC